MNHLRVWIWYELESECSEVFSVGQVKVKDRTWECVNLRLYMTIWYRLDFCTNDKKYKQNHYGQMGVSKNRDTSKWMVYNGKPYQNGWFGGTPIFGHTQIRRPHRLEAIIPTAPSASWPWGSSECTSESCGKKWTVLNVETFQKITWYDNMHFIVNKYDIL